MPVRRNVKRKKKVLFPRFSAFPFLCSWLFLSSISTGSSFPWVPACSVYVRGRRKQLLRGGVGQQSGPCAALGRLWQQQQRPCSCSGEEQHTSVELMPEPTAGSAGTQAAVQRSEGAFCQRPARITHNCSLPIKVPVSPVRLWLRDLKTHSFLGYLCQRVTPNTNCRSLLVVLDRCKIFTAAFK